MAPNKTSESRNNRSTPLPVWERVATFGCGIIGVSCILVLVTLNPDPSTAQWKVYWAVLALTMACIGALLPGFIELKYKNVLRAGGALACFTVVLFGGGYIQGLGGPTPTDMSAQASALMKEAELDRGALGPSSLDRLSQAKALYKKAGDASGEALVDLDICKAQYAVKDYASTLTSCQDAEAEIDLIPSDTMSEVEKLKALALATLYFASAQDRVKATLDTPNGVRQALDYAEATNDPQFVVEFSQQAAQDLFDNNGGAASLSIWGYYEALTAMAEWKLDSEDDFDFVAQTLPGLLKGALVLDVDGADDLHAAEECSTLRDDVRLALGNFDMWLRSFEQQGSTWNGVSPRSQTEDTWDNGACVLKQEAAKL